MTKLTHVTLPSLIALAGSVAACSGQVASSDPASTQTQAQSTASTDASAAKPPHHHRGPPPEAFAACDGKAVGDVCSVKIRDTNEAGKCVAPPPGAPADARIACRPDNMLEGPGGHAGGPGGHGPPPPAVFTACEGKAQDAACSVTFGDHTMDGTCKPPPSPYASAAETRLGCAPAAAPIHDLNKSKQ